MVQNFNNDIASFFPHSWKQKAYLDAKLVLEVSFKRLGNLYILKICYNKKTHALRV
jgi:hypothetical protein